MIKSVTRLSCGAPALQLSVLQTTCLTDPTITHQYSFGSSTVSAATAIWLPPTIKGWLRWWQRGGQKYPASPLQSGRVSPPRSVPSHIVRPEYAAARGSSTSSSHGPGLSKRTEIHIDEASRAAMRQVGQLAARALQLAGSMAAPGTTTDAIDAAVHTFLISNGAYPSPLMYHGFPKSVCTSVNEAVCHGIPDSRPLQDGDIINVDVTAYLNGYHGDTNATFVVGHPSDAAVELVEVTRACLDAAVSICGPGVPFKAIGHTINKIAEAAGMSVVRDFVGHGIGKQFHAAPAVLHHRNHRPGRMQPWQTFTIEPILTLGTRKEHKWKADPTGWTHVTADGSLAAQFEHTLMVTDVAVEVLTVLPEQQ